MTRINILITRDTEQGTKIGVPGQITFIPTRPRIIEGTPDNLVLPSKFSVKLVNGEAAVDLAPTTAEWVWRVETQVQAYYTNAVKYVVVPNVESMDFTDLIEVDPQSFLPTAPDPDPLWYSYVEGLELAAREAADSAIAAAASLGPIKEAVEASETAAANSASDALDSAGDALTSATEAATSAQEALSSALDSSTSAMASAQSASDSEAERLAAETARTGAETAQTLSETAHTLSETARAGSEAARDAAEDFSIAAGDFHSTTVQTGAVVDGQLILTRNDATQVDAGKVILPTEISIGEVETGPETPGIVGPEGPQGLKGDPGGIALGTLLGNPTDLNSITTPGVYRTTSTTGITNLPTNVVGTLTVLQQSTSPLSVVQEYVPFTLSFTRRGFYNRILSTSGSWSPWNFFTTTRVDQTAGRTIYQWDDANNREQLIYGDTGWRDIKADVIPENIASLSALYIRRVGQEVMVMAKDLLYSAGSGHRAFYHTPSGFKPPTFVTGGARLGVFGDSGTTNRYMIWSSGGSLATMNPSSTNAIDGTVSWLTTETWPTTLPGVAVGTIPNT